MYYPSYEDYMRDVFYFNGLTNPNCMYYPATMNSQNLNNMYPSIYKIVNPVIQKVVAGNSYQFTNEDTVNNIVNVVMGITAGDINNLENIGNNNTINTSASSSSNYQNSSNSQGQNTSQVSTQNIKSQNITENPLLKDLIKILTIKEMASKNNIRRFPYTYGEMNNQMLPYMVN